jgi:hypothetical protein
VPSPAAATKSSGRIVEPQDSAIQLQRVYCVQRDSLDKWDEFSRSLSRREAKNAGVIPDSQWRKRTDYPPRIP